MRQGFAMLMLSAAAGQVLAQDADVWLITRETVMERAGFHVVSVLPSGTPVYVRAVKDGAVETPFGSCIPLTHLMTPADAIAYYSQRIDNSLFEISAVDARLSRGKSYFAAQLYAQAIDDYNAVLKREPRNAEALLQRGIAHEQMGAVELAFADIDSAVKSQPGFAEAWYRRCALNVRNGRREAAAEDLGELVRLDKRAGRRVGYDPGTWRVLASRLVQRHFKQADWTKHDDDSSADEQSARLVPGQRTEWPCPVDPLQSDDERAIDSWQRLKRGGENTSLAEIQRFFGWLNTRLAVPIWQRWEIMVALTLADTSSQRMETWNFYKDRRDHLSLTRSGLCFESVRYSSNPGLPQSSPGTSLERTAAGVIVKQGARELLITEMIPGLHTDAKASSICQILFASDAVAFVAVHGICCFPDKLYCLNCKTGEVAWSAAVDATQPFSRGGPIANHDIELTSGGDRVAIFACGNCCYVAVFEVATGRRVFRFCSD